MHRLCLGVAALLSLMSGVRASGAQIEIVKAKDSAQILLAISRVIEVGDEKRFHELNHV